MAWRSREAAKAYDRSYRAANREKLARRDRAYRKANKEKIATYMRAYHKANKAKLADDRRALYTAKPHLRFAKMLWHHYRITREEWGELLISQAGRCAICTTALNPHGRNLATDHDHKTGAVRGILCVKCNITLHALDSWPHAAAALAYLEKHGKRKKLKVVRN